MLLSLKNVKFLKSLKKSKVCKGVSQCVFFLKMENFVMGIFLGKLTQKRPLF